MIHRIILFCVIALFSSLEIDAQLTKKINAVIEDDKFLCILKSIDFYPDSTVATWKLKSKTRNSKFKLSEHVSIKEIETGISHKQITDSKDLQETIRFKKIYDIKEFKTCFPAINDSALISIYLSSTIYVDSLKLKPESFLNELYRYRVPIFNHPLLFSKTDSIEFINEMYDEGVNWFKNGNYQLAIISFEKSLAVERQLDWRTIWENFNGQMWIANAYFKLGNLKEAEKYSRTYYVEPYHKKLRERADSLEIVSSGLHGKQELETLIEICKLDSINIGENSFRFAESLYNLAVKYTRIREYKRSKATLEQAKKVIIDNYNDKNWLISSIYKEFANLSSIENDYISAIRYMKKGLEIDSDIIKIEEENAMLSDYEKLAYYYKAAGNWDKGLEIMELREKYWHDKYNKSPHKSIAPLGPWSSWYDNQYAYHEVLSDYASFLSAARLDKQALRKYKESLNVKGWHTGWFDNSWPERRNLGDYYLGLKDYNEALINYEKAAKDYLSSEGNGQNDMAYLNILNSIAIAHANNGDIKKAITIQKDVINKAMAAANKRHSMYGKWEAGYDDCIDYISNLARYFNLDQQYDSAIIYEEKSLKVNRIYCPTNYDLAYSYMNLGYSYAGKKMWNEALKNSLQANNLYDRKEDRKFYLRSLTDLSNCYFHLYRYTDLEKSIHEMMEVAGHALYSTIQELTYDERSRFIDEYSDLMNQKIPMYAYYTCSDSIIEESYNASLIMKGALLNSENSVKRVINDSEDKSLKSMWDEMKSDRYILSKELQRDSLERKLNVDSLQKVIYNLEDTLILKCKEYGDITQSMKLKWQDVQKTLRPENIAIEFLSFPINNDSVMYVALTLRKESKFPKMITLFEERQLKQVSDTLYYQCKEMTDLVWQPLQAELEGIKNIYFSPSGALYNIGIEYLPGMEDYNIYRLSSTRELITGGKTETKNRAVLYGGLRYDAGFDKSVTEKSLAILDEAFKERANVRGMGLRGGKEYLKHTKEEVDIIGEELGKLNWECVIDSAAMGTEESFKALSGRKVGCLHISTHGFYYNKEDADNARYKFMLIDNNMVSDEDKALTRSGLVMSGANHILEGDTLPDNVEDGILTAKEIADVDLRGLDLVVLSACQTGLGDIAQGEGVFGLQRGFKKAGANSILMSLWEVDDKATQILMTQFYRNLLSGQSKRQSLLSAQKNLREYRNTNGEQCYNSPKYWAAFILLDGIN